MQAQHVASQDAFLSLAGSTDEPLLLKGAPFDRSAAAFNVSALVSDLGGLQLPEKSFAAKQGMRSVSGCSIFIAEQGKEAVLAASPAAWDPKGCTFGGLADAIAGGSGQYLTTRSGKGACRRLGDAIVYQAGSGNEADPDQYDVVVKEFLPRVPWPLLLPEDKGFQVAFWMGAQGNNFGLHTDLFAEQFLVQHQGVKEVFLLLPEDASVVAPFPFLSSPLWYKSQRRTVADLDLSCCSCLRAELHPGDVLFIPLWWWHEVRTISPGCSLSTTFRFHTEDADRFSKVMNSFYQFHRNAQERRSGRLARHLRSFFAYGLAQAEAQSGGAKAEGVAKHHGFAAAWPRRSSAWALALLGAAAAGAALGFAAGRAWQGAPKRIRME